jgi:hypothetical protein
MKIRELLEGKDPYDPVIDSGISDIDYADRPVLPTRRGSDRSYDDDYVSTSKVKWKHEDGEIYGKPYNTIAIIDELDLDSKAWLFSLKSMQYVSAANHDGKTYVYYIDDKRK